MKKKSMAHNCQLESNPSSSDDEEEASGSEEEQSSGSDDEQSSGSESEQKHEKALILPSHPPQSTNKSQIQDQSSSENEDSGSETDSDSPPEKSAVAYPKVKPIASNPMVRDEKSKIDSKKPKKTGSVSGSKTSTTAPPAKRPAPAIEKDAKKAKSNTVTDDDSKKQLFQRLWSEDDEIVILQGMIDYKNEKNGESPVNDMGAFHEFIKKSLHVDVSTSQLVNKVRKLKQKYVNNASREKSSREKSGKDRSFSKSHEQKGYELSKLIWGGGGGNSSGVESKKIQSQKNGNVKGNAAGISTSTVVKSNGVGVKEVSVMKGININRFVQYGRNGSPILDEEIMKGGMELVEESKREELEEKWKELKKQELHLELQLYVNRMELVKQQALVVLKAVSSSEN